MTVEMKPVSSSNIKAIGYDPATKEMHIDFGESKYAYDNVPPSAHAAILAAGSVGKHFHANIKGKFGHRKI